MSWASVGVLEFDGEYPVLTCEGKEYYFYSEDVEDVQRIPEGSRIAFEVLSTNNKIIDYEYL